MKIDVEGFELGVLRGMSRLLAVGRPMLMVEIQADREPIFQLLSHAGYETWNERVERLTSPAALGGNVFCFHREAHRDRLEQLPGIGR